MGVLVNGVGWLCIMLGVIYREALSWENVILLVIYGRMLWGQGMGLCGFCYLVNSDSWLGCLGRCWGAGSAVLGGVGVLRRLSGSYITSPPFFLHPPSLPLGSAGDARLAGWLGVLPPRTPLSSATLASPAILLTGLSVSSWSRLSSSIPSVSLFAANIGFASRGYKVVGFLV